MIFFIVKGFLRAKLAVLSFNFFSIVLRDTDDCIALIAFTLISFISNDFLHVS